MGLALFALGVIGARLALAGVLRPVPLALAAGAAVALFGAQHPLAGSGTAVVAYALTGALAIASFAVYLRAHQTVLLVASGVGLRLRRLR